MDEKNFVEETTEAKTTLDASVEENILTDSVDIANKTASANGVSDAEKVDNVVEEKSYQARVRELLKWQNKLADEQVKIEANRVSILQQMGELEQKKKIAFSKQQVEIQEERQKFEADLAATKAEKDAEILSMIENEWNKFEKKKENQIVALKKLLETMRSQAASEIQTMKSDACEEIKKEQVKLQQLEIELEKREAQVNEDTSNNAREKRRLDREKQRINDANDNLEQEIQDRFSDRIDSYECKLKSKDEELERLRSELASLTATSESIQSLRVAYGMDPGKIKTRIADLEARNQALLDEAANSTTSIDYDRFNCDKLA